MPDQDKKIALVLSGGGAKGAFQVGALEVFFERGYQFDVLSGVSVGALNGAMIATQQFKELQRLWQVISRSDILTSRSLAGVIKEFTLYKIGLTDPPRGLNDHTPLKRLLTNHLLGQEVQIPFHFGFVSLQKGHYVNATIRRNGHQIDEDDILRVLASSAIPVQFDPVDFYGQVLVDGGIRNISPIAEVLPYNPDEVVIIPTEPIGNREEDVEVNDILKIAKRAIDVMLEEIFKEDIKRFVQINRLVGQAEQQGSTLKKPNGMPYKFIKSHIVAPQELLGDSLNFKRDKLEERYERGKKRAQEILDNVPEEEDPS
ncbi:patatin-like phospholipase family protein [Fodinibius salsisoli]|uniref:Patatin-like phospholipase family protein n=1 Tax=Fodinibius salsisoli TaxID=2820877 RepID=A0ABT3PSE9_9BACT|nr:patatin-like phospholipase family protein [Fodinibius salsisoli]MCW9708761.1 patatin-like phospholipase family protein [Fodinibius salsisoli]